MYKEDLMKCYIESTGLEKIMEIINSRKNIYYYSLSEKFSTMIPLQFNYETKYLVPQTDGTFKEQNINKMFYEKAEREGDPSLMIQEITTDDQIVRLTLDRMGHFRNRNGLIYSSLSILPLTPPSEEITEGSLSIDKQHIFFSWLHILDYLYLKNKLSKDEKYKDSLKSGYEEEKSPKGFSLIDVFNEKEGDIKTRFDSYNNSEKYEDIMKNVFKNDFNRFVQNEYYLELEKQAKLIPTKEQFERPAYLEFQYIEPYTKSDYKFPKKFVIVNADAKMV